VVAPDGGFCGDGHTFGGCSRVTPTFPLVPHAPAWECSLGRVTSSSLSYLGAKNIPCFIFRAENLKNMGKFMTQRVREGIPA